MSMHQNTEKGRLNTHAEDYIRKRWDEGAWGEPHHGQSHWGIKALGGLGNDRVQYS